MYTFENKHNMKCSSGNSLKLSELKVEDVVKVKLMNPTPEDNWNLKMERLMGTIVKIDGIMGMGSKYPIVAAGWQWSLDWLEAI
jgi:hypothetical protein